ncbi:MAG: hypothetical protein ABFD92_20950 [Planctomycetaceae bacterium]
MSDEKALTTTSQASALDVYGSGTDIKTLAERIKLCLPNGNKLQANEALALAQLAVAYELNPFNGEVWYIPGRGTMVGIKGLRKAARKQGNYWPAFDIIGEQEKAQLGIPKEAVAYRCKIYQTDLLRKAAEAIDLLTRSGMKDAFEVYAYRPAEGIGYGIPSEDSRMKLDQRARKRAEADALKVAFDLPFASEVGNGDRVGYVDAEWTDVSDQQQPGQSGPKWTPEVVNAGEEPPAKPEPPRPSAFPSGPIPCEPSKFFAAVNKETNFYYRNLSHLANALKGDIGRTAWPATKDVDAWGECWAAAVKHAESKRQESEPPTEQPPLVDDNGDLLPPL